MSALGDRRLAELAADGDERAFEVLLRRHRGELERYCRRLGVPEHRAEDVLQQSFTRAWVALRGGSVVAQPRPWLFRIVHNNALNAHRSARLRRHEPIESAALAAVAADVETGLFARDALRQVAALPQMQRDAVVMTAIEGRSHEEAAGVLGVSDGAVRGLVHRARTTLRAAAAALSPQGLAGLLARASRDGAIAEHPIEAGAAGAGLAGVLSKGAAVTAVTGLLAGGAVVQLEHHRHAHRPQRVVSATTTTDRAEALAAPGLAAVGGTAPHRRPTHAGEDGASSGRRGGRHGRRDSRGGGSGDGSGGGHEVLDRNAAPSEGDGGSTRGRGHDGSEPGGLTVVGGAVSGRDGSGSGHRGSSSEGGGGGGAQPAPGTGDGSGAASGGGGGGGGGSGSGNAQPAGEAEALVSASGERRGSSEPPLVQAERSPG
jgi:RNA polymerase sigma factor (sigma-70 family)